MSNAEARAHNEAMLSSFESIVRGEESDISEMPEGKAAVHNLILETMTEETKRNVEQATMGMNDSIDEDRLPPELKNLWKNMNVPLTDHEDIEAYNEFVEKAGEKSSTEAESLTGVRFQFGSALSVDQPKLKNFVSLVEANIDEVFEAAKSTEDGE